MYSFKIKTICVIDDDFKKVEWNSCWNIMCGCMIVQKLYSSMWNIFLYLYIETNYLTCHNHVIYVCSWSEEG